MTVRYFVVVASIATVMLVTVSNTQQGAFVLNYVELVK